MIKKEFIVWMHEYIDRFSYYWDALSEKHPETPEAMPEPDWFEQFEMYLESNDACDTYAGVKKKRTCRRCNDSGTLPDQDNCSICGTPFKERSECVKKKKS